LAKVELSCIQTVKEAAKGKYLYASIGKCQMLMMGQPKWLLQKDKIKIGLSL
jgi:hypothetical protein